VKKDDENAAIVIGIGLLLMAGSGKHPAGPRGSVPPLASGIPWGAGWSWPVPAARIGAKVYDPEVSNPFRPPTHAGVDVMFRRSGPADVPQYPPGSTNGSTMYFAPPGTPILAAKDARVWSVIRTVRGWGVVLDHGRPFATFYQHLETVDFPVHAMGYLQGTKTITTVKAGDRLGTMGADPTDAMRLRHLHFAVWYQGHGDSASVDPQQAMTSWARPAAWTVT